MIDLTKIVYKQDRKPKLAFYSSDYGKLEADLWCALKNIPPTNPPEWHDYFKMETGKAIEMKFLEILKQNGQIPKTYVQETDGRVDFVRNGVTIHGYIDAKTNEGLPVEIKTLNNANKWAVADYEANKPRENYVGQLAIYMDSLGVNQGQLIAFTIDGLNRFVFTCQHLHDRVYKCGDIEVDLEKEYQRWASIKSMVDNDIEPNWNECRYKIPIEEIKWSEMETAEIKKAMLGEKVIGGGWEVNYSPYKDLILEKQGATLGYTDQERKRIGELANYQIVNGRMTKIK